MYIQRERDFLKIILKKYSMPLSTNTDLQYNYLMIIRPDLKLVQI